jgi:hypothetical protein
MGRAHAIALGALLALFLFRVIAQVLQAVAPTDALPAFEAWHSGALLYPVLLASQAAIVALFVWLILSFWRAKPFGGACLRAALWILGSLYLLGSVVRFVGGFTFAADNKFMAAHLPAFFYIVLALAVIVIASYVSRVTRQEASP